jgi:peptide chain release factor subunit 3
VKVLNEKNVNMNPYGMIEVDKTREPISIVFIGNTGVGKSTICGAILNETGAVKNEQWRETCKAVANDKGNDSWYPYLMDVLEDEKNRGRTLEVGRA